jgi:hypothetical protein
MAKYVRRPDGADPQIAIGPHLLRLVPRIESYRVDQFCGAAGRAGRRFGMTLRTLARLNECILDVATNLLQLMV